VIFCRLFGNFAESLAYSKFACLNALYYPLLSRFSTSEFFRAKRPFPLSASILPRLADVISDTDKGKCRFARENSLVENRLCNNNNACVVSLMLAIRDIRFEFNYSGSQFWFLQWLSLANPVLPTEMTICRFSDEWGVFHPPPPTPPCSAAPAVGIFIPNSNSFIVLRICSAIATAIYD
jgi:hypothetical protein